ncbi:uncharacterized protein DUF2249 [Ureibacillus xyleni]|uniref:Uncharacterized protein DUF2249 n=1 Tax=Ureibacillus xyleni TaxID=614648 RepID=A0A285RY28_9BACL|nr:DUF2249 domain-containing protein [Ureibacillus xyleni]SOB99362.1 uncharacterized protein DUF2249 [Ureibacillus xyleni]
MNSIKLHAPDIPPKVRHFRIFEAFEKLDPGEYLELTNDHDPKPLYYVFSIEREGTFEWSYLEEGPELWRVAIKKI